MTQEEKQLVFVDLCGRLPYNVVVQISYTEATVTVNGKNTVYEDKMLDFNILETYGNVKPYLRPMSSITEKELLEYFHIKYSKVTYKDKWKRIDVGKYHNVGIIPIDEYLDWLNAHHFDFRNLIGRGLALEAPDGMY